jgi:hypothetical protein
MEAKGENCISTLTSSNEVVPFFTPSGVVYKRKYRKQEGLKEM